MAEAVADSVDHDCMDYRDRGVVEGDDVIIEYCTRCGRVRFEQWGDRPMAWMRTGLDHPRHLYLYPDPRNTPHGPEQWRVAEWAVNIRSIPDGYDPPEMSNV